ncbi:MAG: sigma-54 dependent transcriptional regulator [Porticoccaceae bacterium]
MSVHDAPILIIDDDSSTIKDLQTVVEFLGYSIISCVYPDQWLAAMNPADTPLAVVCGGDRGRWSAAMDSVREFDARLPIILLRKPGGSDPVALRFEQQVLGVLDYPLRHAALTNLLAQAKAAYAVRARRNPMGADLSYGLVGQSRRITWVRQLISQVCGSDATVLLLGDSGTGKEVVARNVHYNSPRRDKPFVPVNCGAIPSELLESELFGHEKGAFTGAISTRQGRFEMAEGGTLFLDEIGDMSLDMQVKLLRVLQERSFERVGSNKTITTDVRILAATHRNLDLWVEQGRFRLDLFYRLNVFPIELPSLRDRHEDIPALVSQFVERLEKEMRGSVAFSTCALAALAKYPWPGNVRELANLVERLAILFPGKTVCWQDLPEKYRSNGDWVAELIDADAEVSVARGADNAMLLRGVAQPLPRDGLDLRAYLENLEADLIREALNNSDWVVARAAKLLKLQRTTLVEKMRKFDISRAATTSEI